MRKADAALAVVRALRKAGHEAFFAGGCVRDRLRGVEPKDFDVATSARPEQVQKLFEKNVPVGAQFGVILVLLEGNSVEVATFRAEGEYRDGRRPSQVEFTTVEADARRRDFTVNGLYEDPETGQVLDFVGGQKDLKAKIIRAIGEPAERFGEDHLRMLRAVRFAVQLGFDIEPGTSAAVVPLAPKILDVSWERIRDELVKTVTSSQPARGLRLLDELGLLKLILPEIELMKGVEQPMQYHPEGDVFVHTLMLMEQLSNPPMELALGALLHDVAKPQTFERAPDRIRFHGHDRIGAQMSREICRRLVLSNPQIDLIESLVAEHLRFKDAFQMKQSTLKRFLSLPRFDLHLELHRIDCLASHGKLDAYDYCKEKYEAFLQEPPPPLKLITGADLIALGYSPGPLFSEILRVVEDAILEGTVTDRDGALELVRKEFGGRK